MFGAFLQKATEGIEGVKRHLQTSEMIRLSFGTGSAAVGGALASLVADAPDERQWRIIDQSAAVSRLYAIYENYTHELVREYVAFLEDTVPFESLDGAIAKSYRFGVSEILKKLDRARYQSVNLADLITSYAGAISRDTPYRLEASAFLTHDKNLNLATLNEVFSLLGIVDVAGWIERHSDTRLFFAPGDRLGSTAAAEMKRFLDDRNDAAHRSLTIDDLIGLDVLIEYAEFLEIVLKVLAEKIQISALKTAELMRHAVTHGSISDVYMNKSVMVGKFSGSFYVGHSVYICGDDFCEEAETLSMQLDDIDVLDLSLPTRQELGVKLNGKARKKAKVMSFNRSSTLGFEPENAADDGADESEAEPWAEVLEEEEA